MGCYLSLEGMQTLACWRCMPRELIGKRQVTLIILEQVVRDNTNKILGQLLARSPRLAWRAVFVRPAPLTYRAHGVLPREPLIRPLGGFGRCRSCWTSRG